MLIEGDGTTTTAEQRNVYTGSSPVDILESKVPLPHGSAECSIIVESSQPLNSKAMLNVGGVRHEGSFHYFIPLHKSIVMSIYSDVAYSCSFPKYSSRSFEPTK